MNQFKSSWEFAFSNWKYFLALGLPLIVIESLSAFLIMPLGEMTQPEDIAEICSTTLKLPMQSVPFEIALNCNYEI